MTKRFQYIDEEDRQRIIAENSHLKLVGEEFLLDGNFLVFEAPSPTDLEIRELKRQNADFMVAMAELAAIITAGGGTA